MPARQASSARVAWALVRLASVAILPTRSRLFMTHPRCPRVLSNARRGVKPRPWALARHPFTVLQSTGDGDQGSWWAPRRMPALRIAGSALFANRDRRGSRDAVLAQEI